MSHCRIEETPNPIPSPFELDVVALATHAHDMWRSTRVVQNSDSYTPRPKPTTDEAWVLAHGGQTIVDIANTTYVDLPADHQEEIRASAIVALTGAYSVGFYGEGWYENDRDFLNIKHFTDHHSSVIHVMWLRRNSDHAQKEQKLPYEKLSAEEQKKDQEIYEGAAAIVNQHLTTGDLVVPDNLLFEWCMRDLEYMKDRPGPGPFYTSLNTTVGETHMMGDGNVRLNLDVPWDNLHLHGVYALSKVTRLVRDIRTFTPDALDYGPSAMGADEVRRAHIRHFLSSTALG